MVEMEWDRLMEIRTLEDRVEDLEHQVRNQRDLIKLLKQQLKMLRSRERAEISDGR